MLQGSSWAGRHRASSEPLPDMHMRMQRIANQHELLCITSALEIRNVRQWGWKQMEKSTPGPAMRIPGMGEWSMVFRGRSSRKKVPTDEGRYNHSVACLRCVNIVALRP